MMWLALGLGIFAGLLALVTVADLLARIFTEHGVIGGWPLPIWRLVALAALISIFAVVAIWLLTLTLPRALA